MTFAWMRLLQIAYEGEGGGGGGSAPLLGGGGAAPPPTDPAGAVTGLGGKPWFEGFKNEDVKTFVGGKNYADPEATATALWNLTRHQGGAKDVLRIPEKDDDADGWSRVYDSLGRPKTAAEYSFKFGDDVKVDPKIEGFAKELFHGAGMSPARAQAAAEKWNATVKEVNEQAQKDADIANTAAIDKLKASWGAKWDENIKGGQQAVRALGLTDEALSSLDGAMGSANVMHLMAMIGSKLGKEGGGLVDPNPQNPGGGGITKESAAAEINRLMNDKAFQTTLTDQRDPNRAANLKKWEDLHRIRG